jgi:hypothetical protein
MTTEDAALDALAVNGNLIGDPGFESGLSDFYRQNSADVLTRTNSGPISGRSKSCKRQPSRWTTTCRLLTSGRSPLFTSPRVGSAFCRWRFPRSSRLRLSANW